MKYLSFLFLSIFLCNAGKAQIISQPTDTTICQGEGANFLVNTVYPDSGFQWQLNTAGWIDVTNSTTYSGAQSDSLIINNSPLSLDSTWYRCIIDTNGVPVDTTDSVQIFVLPFPVSYAGIDSSACSGSSSIPISGVAGGTYASVNWTATLTTGSGGISSGQNTLSPIFTPGSDSGLVILTLVVSGTGACSGMDSTSSRQIRWDAPPICNAPTSIFSCSGLSPITVPGTVSGSFDSLIWNSSLINGNGTITSGINSPTITFTPSTDSGRVQLNFSALGSGACTGTNTMDSTEVIWGSPPSVSAGPLISTCTGTAPITISGSALGSFDSLSWIPSLISGNGTITSGTNTQSITFTPSTDSGRVQLFFSAYGTGACTGVNDIDSTILFWGTPPIVNAGPQISSCTGLAPISIYGNASGSYSTLDWTATLISGSGNISSGTNSQNISFTPASDSGRVKLYFSASGAGVCTGFNDIDSTILIWGTPPVVNAGPQISSCSGLAPISISGIASGSFSTLDWTASLISGSGNISSGTNSQNISFTPATDSGRVKLFFSAFGTGACTGLNDIDSTILVWGTPPVVNAGPQISSCSGLAPISISGIASGSYSTLDWTASLISGSGNISSGTNSQNISFTPATDSGRVKFYFAAYGTGACFGINSTDSTQLIWGTPPVVSAGPQISTCTGQSPIIVSGSASGSFDSLFWSESLVSGNGNISTSTNSPTITFSPSTDSGRVILYFSAFGGSACSSFTPTDSTLLIWGTPPNANAGFDISTCSGTPIINLGGSATGNFSNLTWNQDILAGNSSLSPSSGTFVPTFSPISQGGSTNAILTVSGSGVCTAFSDSDTVNVQWGTPPVASAGSNISTCYSGTPINISGNLTGTISNYSWTFTPNSGNGILTNTTTLNPILNPSTSFGSGQVTLLAAGDWGCSGISANSTILVTWDSMPTANAGPNISSCTGLNPLNILGTFGGSIDSLRWFFNPSSGSGVFSSNGGSSNTFLPGGPSGNGQIVFTAFGRGACAGTNVSDTAQIVWAEPPLATAGPPIETCNNASPFNISGNAGGSIIGFSWSYNLNSGTGSLNTVPPTLNPLFSPSSPSGNGLATLIVNGLGVCNGVRDTAFVPFEWGTPPSISISGPISSCTGSDSIFISGNASGNYTAPTWQFFPGVGSGTIDTSINSISPVFLPISSQGNGTILFHVAGSEACQDSSADVNTTIEWATPPNISIEDSIEMCSNSPSVTISTVDTVSYYSSVLWSTSGTGSLLSQNQVNGTVYFPSPNDIANGGVHFTLFANGYSPCPTDSASKFLKINEYISSQVSYPENPYCSSDTLAAPQFQPGTSGSIFTPSSSLVAIDSVSGVIDIQATAPGNYVIHYLVQGAGVCPSDSNSTNFTLNVQPQPNVQGDSSLCKGSFGVEYCTDSTPNQLKWSILNGILNTTQTQCVSTNWGNFNSGQIWVFENIWGDSTCIGKDSLSITLSGGPAPPLESIALRAEDTASRSLVCQFCVYNYFQWGFEDKITRNESTVSYCSNDVWCLYPHMDTTQYYYWVRHGDDLACLTKSYYNPPPAPIGIDESFEEAQILIYPNPTTGLVKITSSESIQSWRVSNAQGQVIATQSLGLPYPGTQTINLEEFSSGLYFIGVQNRNDEWVWSKVFVESN